MRSIALGCSLALVAVIARAGTDAPAGKDLVRAGRGIYQSRCASCHGARAEGASNWQQPDTQGELPAPPHDRRGHTWKHGDGMLYRIVRDGWRDPFNKTQRLTMPAFRQTLSPKETRMVIEYLKTLWTNEQKRFQREESRREHYPAQER